jgi:hypothetical protein
MFTDVVQLKLERPSTESDEGISLAAFGKFSIFEKQLIHFLFLL